MPTEPPASDLPSDSAEPPAEFFPENPPNALRDLRRKRVSGWKAEEPGSLDTKVGPKKSAAEHFGAPRNLPSESLALANSLPLKDQGPTSTCVGHGIACAADARLRVIGAKAPYGSPRAIYTLSNMLLRAKKTDPIENDGTVVRTAMKAAADFGIPPEELWPLWKDGSVLDVTEPVPPDVLARASAWKLVEQYVITTKGQSRILSVASALSQLHPIPVAGDVDEAFEAYDGKGVLTAPDPKKIVGGHMVCIVGYRTNSAGRFEFLIANSWPDWGLIGGFAWVDEAWVMAMRELYAFTVTHGPNGGEA